MEDCVFCKIIKGEIPSTKVYEDDKILCFKDINPAAPVHIIMVPKKHISSLNELSDEDQIVIGHIFLTAKKIAKENNISKDGYRIVTNCGEKAGQSVKHIHFHLLGGRSFNWPPG